MGQGTTLAVLGGVVLAVAGVGVWFALDDGGAADETAPEAASSPPPSRVEEPSPAVESKGGRRRAKVVGTCAVTGTVKKRKAMEAAAGQTVELVLEGAEPWTATCDAGGAFAFEAIPDGGPYEVRVRAEGFAPVRIPGIALARHERRDVGTLWLDRAVRVPVSVRTTTDLPVEGATVEAFAAAEMNQGWDWTKAIAQIGQEAVPVSRTVTDAQGKAVFDGIAGGMWTFVASKSGLSREGKASLSLRGGEDVPEVKIYLGTGHTLKGRVLDGERKPVAGALVLAGRGSNMWDFSSSPMRVRAVADAEGRYVLADLPAADLTLLAGRPGGVPSQVAVVRVPAVKEFDIVLRSGGTLVGTVTDSKDGKPVEGAVVRASAWGQSVKVVEATTDAQGKYRIESVPDGQIHDVRAEKEGYVPDRRNQPPWMQPLSVPIGETATKDLRLRMGATLRGTVTGPDGPLAGARVNAQSWNPQRGVQWQKTVTTDAAGKYEMTGAEPGKTLVQVTREGHYQKGFPENPWMALQQPGLAAEWKTEIAETGETTFDVKMEKGVRVEGRVDGPEGPLADVKVGIGGASATTQADGTFLAEGVAPGRPWVVATKKGFLDTKPEQVTVGDSAPTTGIVRKLVRQPVVRGRVTSAAGLQLTDAQVSAVVMPPGQQGQAFPMEGWGPDMSASSSVPVLPDGTFEAPLGAAEGRVTVRATALDHARGEASTDLRAGMEFCEVNVALEVGSAVRGRTVGKNGAAVAGAQIGVRKATGAEQQQQYWNGQQMSTVVAVSDAQGAFAVQNVANGTWEVSATAEGRVRKAMPNVKVPGAGDVVLEMEDALEIAGKVVFADGSPAPGANVMPQKEAGDGQQFYGWGGVEQATTDASGGFRLRNLAPGSYRLLIQPSWAGTVNLKNKRSDAIAAGTTDVRILVEAGGLIAGRVVDVKKAGLSGIWINANRAAGTPAEENDPYGGWRSAMTKDDGSFELVGLADGAWNLMVQPNQGTLRGDVRQNVAVGTKDVEIVLDEGLKIEGTVVKSDGSPVPSLWLQPMARTDPANPMAQQIGVQGAATDSEGKFVLNGLAAARYTITLQQWNNPTNWILQGGEDVAAGTTGVRLTVSEGEKVSGIVVDEAGQPIVGVNMNVRAGDQWKHAVSGADGKFEIAGLASGSQVQIHVNAAGRVGQTLDKIAAGTRDLRIVLEKGMTVLGRLVDASGEPVVGGRLSFNKKSGGRGAGCITQAEGKFTCEGLQDGEYTVSLMRQKTGDGQKGWENVQLGTCRAGDTGVELRIP